MKIKILQDFGLTQNEAKIYLTLLRLGSAYAGEITERSGIHRRNVYDAIERLTEKGLVSSVIVNNKKLFNPVNPQRFVELIEEKKAELDERKKQFKKILPELNLMRELKKKHDVRFFRGIEGLKTLYEDILRTGKDYIGYGPGEQIEKRLTFFFAQYLKRRKKAKIHTRLIYNENSRNKAFTKTPYSEVRFLPEEYTSHSALRIYSDKVAIMLMSKEEPLAIIIKNKAIADGYRKYFEVIWKAAKK
jgi:sugar-specific transcriptional regulator TrmB